MSNLTILIPTSPIPSHPSTEIIDETIENIRKYTDAEIFIMADGVHPSIEHRRREYNEYLSRIEQNTMDGKYGNCFIVIFKDHAHQNQMTKTVLRDYVIETPLIMFVEHDCSPVGDIPFNKICEIVETNKSINYVRFNIFHEILKEHEYLMLNAITINNIPLRRTIQFSARPHIAKSDWYKKILEDHFGPEEKMMIEDRMHSIVIEKYKENNGFEDCGLAIYTPEGNQCRSYHSDGRETDEKIIEG